MLPRTTPASQRFSTVVPDLLAIGECMVELFASESLATATTLTKTFGGDACNVLVAASRLGTATGYITRVGNDPFGSFLLNAWRSEGIDVSTIAQVDRTNGVYFISLLPGGEREFTYYRAGSAASTLAASDIAETYVASAKFVHISGITQAISPSSRQAAQHGAEMAHRHGVRVSFDPNLRVRLWSVEEARQAMEDILPFTAVALPSVPEESFALIGLRDASEVAGWYHQRGVDVVAVKQGSAGVLVSEQGRMTEVPAFTPAHIVDTSGAGDVFDGSFLHGLIAGMSPVEAARLGVVAAGLKVRGRGAIASQAHKEEILAVWEQVRG